MSSEKEEKRETKKPDSGNGSQPNTYVSTKSQDGVEDIGRIEKIKKQK